MPQLSVRVGLPPAGRVQDTRTCCVLLPRAAPCAAEREIVALETLSWELQDQPDGLGSPRVPLACWGAQGTGPTGMCLPARSRC